MPTAVLVDGGFFLRRYRSLCGAQSPSEVADGMHKMCRQHLKERTSQETRPTSRQLFRIFYYDCPPLQKKTHNPLTGQAIDFSKTQTARWRLNFFDELRKRRKKKVALRENVWVRASCFSVAGCGKPRSSRRRIGLRLPNSGRCDGETGGAAPVC